MGGGGPVGDIVGGIGDAIGGGAGIITGALEPAFKGVSKMLDPVFEAIPGGEIIGPALLSMVPGAGPYLAGAYHMGQGDPISAMMSAGLGGFNPFSGSGASQAANPFTKVLTSTPKFLQQTGGPSLQKQITDMAIKTALREGIGYLGEKVGMGGDPTGEQRPSSFTPDLGQGILPQSGDMLSRGLLESVGSGLNPWELQQTGGDWGKLAELLAGRGISWDILPKDKDGTVDWSKTLKWLGIGAAGAAGLYALFGGMEGKDVELPPDAKRYWQSYDYGEPEVTSGAEGQIVGDLGYVVDPVTGEITGFQDMPGAQTILGRYKEWVENLEGKDKEAFDEAQSAAHGGLMSLKDGGSTDIEQIKADKGKLRDMYMADPDAKGVDLEKYPEGIADILRLYMELNKLKPLDEIHKGYKGSQRQERQLMRESDMMGHGYFMAPPNWDYDEEGNPIFPEHGEENKRIVLENMKKNTDTMETIKQLEELLKMQEEQRGTSPEGLGPQGFYRTKPSIEVNPMAGGGFPRKTGAINGPGTGTSDSIPAMLSDGEFVMTADAVRGAGMGDRMAGAKRMYDMMHKFEGRS